ncbi:MAG TPA: ATP-binding protein [Burkholderiales bacterium]|nr:ATP-binding protein [Burkholderiales bacterium]
MWARSLSGKLIVTLTAMWAGVSAAVIFAKETMPDLARVLELSTDVIIGAIAFSLLTAVIVFYFLTRRLRTLAAAMDGFRRGGFTEPVRFAGDPAGDEIDRLGVTFQVMSERIALQLQALEQNDVRRRELLANVSHDLRTPLASMQGYLETLLLKHGTLPPEEERNYLEIAAKHSERLGKLVGDLFQLTKLEAHELQPRPEAFPISELAQDVAQKFQLAAQKRGIALGCRFDEGLPQVHADIGMIERVLENLIENALRHTPRGGAVRVEVGAAGGKVGVRVADTGRGIPQEELAGVFERYYRVDRGEVADAGHAGLGLAITRRIVELHGGTIRVESALGAGTAFSFDLPAA